MRDNSDNMSKAENLPCGRRRLRPLRRLSRRPKKKSHADSAFEALPAFDPELLYVECEKCGAPVLWGEGRATRMLAEAGIDPLELDNSCILLTDGCPVCGLREEYSVRILRSGIRKGFMPVHGHA